MCAVTVDRLAVTVCGLVVCLGELVVNFADVAVSSREGVEEQPYN